VRGRMDRIAVEQDGNAPSVSQHVGVRLKLSLQRTMGSKRRR
jgi:hypothetical protein